MTPAQKSSVGEESRLRTSPRRIGARIQPHDRGATLEPGCELVDEVALAVGGDADERGDPSRRLYPQEPAMLADVGCLLFRGWHVLHAWLRMVHDRWGLRLATPYSMRTRSLPAARCLLRNK